MNSPCPNCRSFMWSNERLTKSSAKNPLFGMCCNSGKVAIEIVPDPPEMLKNLLTATDGKAKFFQTNIRRYNAGMAMASMKAKDATPSGLASYTVEGVVYRRIGPLRNPEGSQPACLQTYFYDSEEQVSIF